MHNTVLVVDDDLQVLKAIKRALKKEPYTLLTCTSPETALKTLAQQNIAVIVADELMPRMRGSQLLIHVKTVYPDIVRMMLTGNSDIDIAMTALNQGEVYRFLLKPWDTNTLIFSIRSAIEKHNLESHLRRLLKIVKAQNLAIEDIEKQFPTIKETVKKTVQRQSITQDEMLALLSEFEKEYT